MAQNSWVFVPDPDVQRVDDINREFVRGNRVGLTFGSGLGDLSQVEDKEEFAARYQALYQKRANASLSSKQAASFGRMFRNLYWDVAINDIVVYSSPVDSLLHIGIVKSKAYANGNSTEQIKHAVDVEWVAHYMRARFLPEILKKIPRQLAISRMTDSNPFLIELKALLRQDGKITAGE